MYWFFIREFNDIDHITPIVWRMHRDHYPVAVFCLNPAYDLRKDYRLVFLKAAGVAVGYVYDEITPDRDLQHRCLRWISRTGFAAANRIPEGSPPFSALFSAVRRPLAKLAEKAHKRCKRLFYDENWARGLIAASGAAALCFDHINPHRHIVQALVQAAQAAGIPTFALPHGVFIYTNDFVRTGSTEEDRYDKFNRFDFIATQNQLRKDVLVRAGVDPRKIFVLGSARYCSEWMTTHRSIIPRSDRWRSQPSGKLKAVFMTTRFEYRVRVERMLATFDLLAKTEGFDFVVKPHTRSGKEADLYNHIPLRNAAEVSSVELCEWADIVLAIASSIIIEPLTQGKPVLYLKYLHENVTQYEEMGAGWTIHDEDELKHALLALKRDISKVPYRDECVTRFLAEIIYGGTDKKDVLKRYEQFIVENSRD